MNDRFGGVRRAATTNVLHERANAALAIAARANVGKVRKADVGVSQCWVCYPSISGHLTK
ncbi:hypothetical protein [Ruegeria arenilitoris]|uniref:hypothetical protein n=1 Tax=Ruegeria arenilitoris TaxID=1173585 RepID=UPI001C2B7E3C|nr:hypothetical protein [Ruegeria arenilitoris]